MRDKSYVPSVAGWMPLILIVVVFVVVVAMLVVNAFRREAELKAAEEEVSSLTITNEILVVELTAANKKLAMPVFVEIVYDPNETIYQPGNPATSTRLQWRIGTFNEFSTQIYTGQLSVVAPIQLMDYRVLYPGGGDMIGNTDLLPAAIDHAAKQQQQLFAEVDNSGFVDR